MTLSSSLEHHATLRAITNGKAAPLLLDELFVGREAELSLVDHDCDYVEAGGGSIRILVGESGAGKTSLLQVIGERARRRGFVTMAADLTTKRLLHGHDGEARALLGEAVRNMRTAGVPGEPAVDSLISRFSNDCSAQANETDQFRRDVIRAKLAPLHQHARGSDFANLIEAYALSKEGSDRRAKALHWLTAGYATITEARADLELGSIIEDCDLWSMLKLWAEFVRIAGRAGLVVMFDEMRVLCGLQNSNARPFNLEQLLSIFNDVLQLKAAGIELIIAATPDFVITWNGLAKHDGLKSCLLRGSVPLHSQGERETVLMPLGDLSEPQLMELLRRCRDLYAKCHPSARLLPNEALEAFLESSRNHIGDPEWHLPRRIMQGLIELQQRFGADQSMDWQEHLFAHMPELDGPAGMFEGYAHRQM